MKLEKQPSLSTSVLYVTCRRISYQSFPQIFGESDPDLSENAEHIRYNVVTFLNMLVANSELLGNLLSKRFLERIACTGMLNPEFQCDSKLKGAIMQVAGGDDFKWDPESMTADVKV